MPNLDEGAFASRARALGSWALETCGVAARTPKVALAARCAALLGLGWLAASCFLLPDYTEQERLAESLPYLPRDSDEPVVVEPVTFGEWRQGRLYCAEEHCYNLYRFDVPERGRLRAEVYAPAGIDIPDFDMTLLDETGTPVAKPVKPGAQPRRIRKVVEPGRYVLRVEALGYEDGPLEYELIAKLTPPRPKVKPHQRKASRPAARPTPAPTPAPARRQEKKPEPAPRAEREPIVSAEVLDVEMVDGAPAFVLLDAGKPHGVEVGLQGQLKTDGAVIGEIEVVEVYADGSRARIVGELRGEVTFETVADIFGSG